MRYVAVLTMVVGILASFPTSVTYAGLIEVPSEFGQIHVAISNAGAEDTVLVSNNTGGGNPPYEPFTMAVGIPVLVASGQAPKIDADGDTHAVAFPSGSDANTILEGNFTITGGDTGSSCGEPGSCAAARWTPTTPPPCSPSTTPAGAPRWRVSASSSPRPTPASRRASCWTTARGRWMAAPLMSPGARSATRASGCSVRPRSPRSRTRSSPPRTAGGSTSARLPAEPSSTAPSTPPGSRGSTTKPWR